MALIWMIVDKAHVNHVVQIPHELVGLLLEPQVASSKFGLRLVIFPSLLNMLWLWAKTLTIS